MILPILHSVFESELDILGVILKCYALSSQNVMGFLVINQFYVCPMRVALRFLTQRNPKHAYCNKGLRMEDVGSLLAPSEYNE